MDDRFILDFDDYFKSLFNDINIKIKYIFYPLGVRPFISYYIDNNYFKSQLLMVYLKNQLLDSEYKEIIHSISHIDGYSIGINFKTNKELRYIKIKSLLSDG